MPRKYTKNTKGKELFFLVFFVCFVGQFLDRDGHLLQNIVQDLLGFAGLVA